MVASATNVPSTTTASIASATPGGHVIALVSSHASMPPAPASATMRSHAPSGNTRRSGTPVARPMNQV